MLGYAAADVMNKITPADISDPQELIVRARALSVELDTPITPGFEALVFKASRGIEDIYELTYIRKDGSRFPAVVSVTALRDAQGGVIGYLLIEGATLGGRIIGRHLQASLGLRADSGAAFFSGYGSATGPLWQAFGDLLRVRAASTDEAEIITGAVQTFDTLDRWLYPPAPMDTT